MPPSNNSTELQKDILVEAYRDLLNFRPTLLDQLDHMENSDIRKRVLVDSMIFGLLNHLN